MRLGSWIASAALLLSVGGAGYGAYAWKNRAAEAAPAPFEPAEAVGAAVARAREHRRWTTAIGTVLALRSVVLRTELPGTVRETALAPGEIVDAGAVLVRLDTAVEEAELRAQEAEAALAETLLARLEQAGRNGAAAAVELDRARAERDVALARIARTRAVIERKTVRAPFRARIGLADLHPGQYLSEGTVLTTLQGVEDAVHVDFSVAQDVAAALRPGDPVEMLLASGPAPAPVVAVDAKIDPATRNARVRARIDGPAPAPGASVRVRVPAGPARAAVGIPADALRRGPDGDHVFVLAAGPDGKMRAQARRVRSGPLQGEEALIFEGLRPGERVAATGSFKLRDGALVAPVREAAKLAGAAR